MTEIAGQPQADLKFKVGDRVTFTNEFGVVFEGHTVTGFYEETGLLYQYGRRYYIDTDCYWFPKKESELSFSEEQD